MTTRDDAYFAAIDRRASAAAELSGYMRGMLIGNRIAPEHVDTARELLAAYDAANAAVAAAISAPTTEEHHA